MRLSRIDSLSRSDHFHLCEDDECYFLGEYTSQAGYQHSDMNQLIFNFKKPMCRKEKEEWQYKVNAISEAARLFREALCEDDLDQITFVPVPPSAAKGTPEYDDRMTQMLRQIRPDSLLDIRELIIQTESSVPVHLEGVRDPSIIMNNYNVDENMDGSNPDIIAIVDDVLATGAHFKAAKSKLSQAFPHARMFGLFIARGVSE